MAFIKTLLKKAVLVLPFIAGFYGFLLEGMNLPDSAYNSIQFYLMGYENSPQNIFTQIARWTAPLAFAGGLVMIFRSIKLRLHGYLRYLRGDSVAVYGTPEERDPLLSQLGGRGVSGNTDFIKAQTYILAGSENENMQLYARFRDRIGDAPVYLRCENLSARALSDGNLKLFSPQELAARIFWKEQNLYPRFLENKGRLSVVLVGFGSLGQQLLLWGLQNLIYAPDQKIRYTVLGDPGNFYGLHPQLSCITDPVCFDSRPWYECRDLLEQADLVLVAEQENQPALVSQMLQFLTREELWVFARNISSLELLEGRPRLRLFDWEKQAQQLPNILDDRLLARAKAINLRYAHLYSGVEETASNRELQWQSLNAFTRGSNISAADYHEVRLKMLEVLGKSPEQASEDGPLLELLSHLEHIRWCRYHWLSGWTFGVPENGKSKDPARRIHQDLIPYENLTEESREKDRENIRLLLSMR